MRRILLTSALPYANGDIHLGYLLEAVQADIWARFQRARGNECLYVCADDAHGTPVMLRAAEEGVPPEQWIAKMRDAHWRDLSAFDISMDHYGSTHSERNRALSAAMYRKLRAAGRIAEREIEQLYDPQKKMFLPDRYVRGECPRCGAAQQYGDSCEKCGGVYEAAELKNPVSVFSGAAPVMKKSVHYFLRLADDSAFLREWVFEHIADPSGGGNIPRLQKEAANKLQEWLLGELRDWDISRDAPYFGFRVPDCDEEKYLYVWLDAPVGYMASFAELCAGENGEDDKAQQGGLCFDDFWGVRGREDTELYHFIGKDILYFHALFWPAMLKNSGHRLPTRVFAHGFLTVNGEKMSKSRGTFITARRYADSGLPPDALRYYYATKLGDGIDDLDLHLGDFVQKVNGDLIGKLVNIPSRTAGFIAAKFGGKLDNDDQSGEGYAKVVAPLLAMAESVAADFESRRYHSAVRAVMHAADTINSYVDANAPWKIKNDDSQRQKLHETCSAALRGFHLLTVYIQPVTPHLAQAARAFLQCPPLVWQGLRPLAAGHRIAPYAHLMARIKTADALIEKPQQ
ncbi:MAG: methionine--tRNA ligase [Gammaproteobacteria bacterium]